jgi:hypothetical protein
MPDNDERQQAAQQLAHAQLHKDMSDINRLGDEDIGPDFDACKQRKGHVSSRHCR